MSLPVLKMPNLDEFKLKLQPEEKKEVVVEPETRLVILHSKEVPDDVLTVLKSIGSVVVYNYKVHSMLSLADISYKYLLIDITNADNRQWLRLHRKEFEAFPNVISYAYSYEVDTLDREDSWLKFSKKVITNFDLVIGNAGALAESLMNSKIKYQSKTLSFLKRLFHCATSQ